LPKSYKKPALTFTDQLQLLHERGLSIPDSKEAIKDLECNSYYRLSAYWYPFRIKKENVITDQIRPKTTWGDIIELYEFDRKLRLLIIDAIDRIEIAVRTQVTYTLAHSYGAFAHTDKVNFHSGFWHKKWLESIEDEVQRSTEEFIQHYKREYEGFPTIPIWMLTEVMSLGSLSRLYKGLEHHDKRQVAQHFDVHHKTLVDWLHTLTYVRNICAHHSRLWNRELSIKPEKSKDKHWIPPITPTNERLFYVLLMVRHLLKKMSCGDTWYQSCNELLEPIASNDLWRNAMGMPLDWKNHPIWK